MYNNICYIYFSDPRDCSTSRTCYEYDPSSGIWAKQPSELNHVKWAHFMGLIDYDESRRVPIVLGYGDETEIFNPDTQTWDNYTTLEEDNWTSTYCLIQVGDSVWQMRTGIYELDLNEWEITSYGSPPDQLQNAGHCSYLEIDGQPGKVFDIYL